MVSAWWPTRAVSLLADRTVLTEQLSAAMARRSFAPVHDRGQVLVDVAVMLADDGEAFAGVDVPSPDNRVGPRFVTTVGPKILTTLSRPRGVAAQGAR